MKRFSWDTAKNKFLKTERGVSFEEAVFHIGNGGVLNIIEHPNQKKYGGQRMFVLDIQNYAYLVPFVETEKEIFLKTIIPSRKMTRKYLRGGGPNG